MKKSRIVLVLCMMVVIAVASVAGTIAWLTDTTDPVVNTFSPSDIAITLEESEDNWSKQLIPGKDYKKDPVVAVNGNKTNVDVYLFVKVTEKNNPKDYLDYYYAWECPSDHANKALYEGWSALNEDGVYYRVVKATDTVKSWPLIVDDTVTVQTNLVKPGTTPATGVVVMPAAADTPAITFTAYAIQTEGMTDAADAWSKIGN